MHSGISPSSCHPMHGCTAAPPPRPPPSERARCDPASRDKPAPWFAIQGAPKPLNASISPVQPSAGTLDTPPSHAGLKAILDSPSPPPTGGMERARRWPLTRSAPHKAASEIVHKRGAVEENSNVVAELGTVDVTTVILDVGAIVDIRKSWRR